jgi:hypothetical protein
MGLRIVPPKKKELQAGGPKTPSAQTTSDGYLDRIVKYIPSQVMTFYTAAMVWITNPNSLTSGGQPATTNANANVQAALTNAGANASATAAGIGPWIVFVLGLGLTIFLTYWQTREVGKPPAYQQIGISTIAFVVWAYALGQPFASIPNFWKPGWAAIVLAVFVIVIGKIVPKEEPPKPNGDQPAPSVT